MTTSPRHVYLIDGYALLYRAFFALISRPLRNSRGENTSAVWGVVNFLLRLREKYRPDYVGWVHDMGTSFREERYPEYKSTREKLDEELQADFDRAVERTTELLAALGIPLLGVPGYEADDVIGTLATQAAGQGLTIDYRPVGVESVDGKFDLVTSMEVVEHVSDPQDFIDCLAARLANGGLMILSTPNKTAWSRLLTITIAEGLGQIPKGTHDFDKFIDPDSMRGLLAHAGLEVIDFEGIALSPTRGLHLSEDLSLNYLVAAQHC